MNNSYRDIGLKLTPQRVAILDYLYSAKKHPSAEEIYKAVKETFPTISIATVYNTLDALKKIGEIVPLSIDPERKRYDLNKAEHNHLYCVKCGKIIDIHENYDLTLSDKDKNGFNVMGNHVQFYGLCNKCT
ncbi:Ferric-uptake regulator [Candidatus Magnetoovum chiemensis]|nr:Ferric-uptake regulator [Candidatus Magnetoovum chiemensis]